MQWVADALYTGRVRALLDALGLDAVVNRAYYRVLSHTIPRAVVLEVDGRTATFGVTNPFEYIHLTDYFPEGDGEALVDLLASVEPDDTFWDVGANVGVWSCFVAPRLESGRVVAVEPHPANTARIESNLGRNGVHATILRYALGAEPGTATLALNSPDVPGAFGSLLKGRDGGVSVAVTTGDDLVDDGAPSPTVLKVDVQGTEFDVLRGFDGALAPGGSCRLVYCNVYRKHFDRPGEGAELEGHLEDRGFEPVRLAEWRDGYYLRAAREG